MLRGFVISLLAISIAGGAMAKSVSIEKYLKDQADDLSKIINISWLDGAFNGFESANIELHLLNQKLLYCIHPSMTLTTGDVKNILDGYIYARKDSIDKAVPIDMVLLTALREKYPCQ